MEESKVKGYLILGVVLAVALPTTFAVVWILTHVTTETLNFIGGAFLVGLPMMAILGGVVFGLLHYMARDRRADTVERMSQQPRQPQVMMLPQPRQAIGYENAPYRYRAVIPGGEGMDDMAVPGVILGEVDRA